VLFTLLAVSCIAGLVAMHFFLRCLRLHHVATWQHLGTPTLVMNNTIRSGLSVMRWLWKKEYVALEDPHLTRFAQAMIAYQMLYLVVFVVVVLFAAPPRTQVI
jgi:hypothetical protein